MSFLSSLMSSLKKKIREQERGTGSAWNGMDTQVSKCKHDKIKKRF
jgi:hypothetical protein